MTQEDKLFLFTDLTARLRYGVIVHYECKWDADISGNGNIRNIYIDDCLESDFAGIVIGVVETGLGYIKPYLRPMSSMTEEEKLDYTSIDNRAYCCPQNFAHIPATDRIDWLNVHHFDYRGLIEKGLALVAPEGMYK